MDYIKTVFFVPVVSSSVPFMVLLGGGEISFHPSVGRVEVDLVVPEDIDTADLYYLIVKEYGQQIPAGYFPVHPDEDGFVVLDSGVAAIQVRAV